MIDTIAGSFVPLSSVRDGIPEAHIVVRSPVSKHGSSAQNRTPVRVTNDHVASDRTGDLSRATAHCMKTALPRGEDIAAALFERPSVRRVEAPPPDTPAAVALTITPHVDAARTTLLFTGAMNAATVHQLRDESFTVIGARPRLLCLDLRAVEMPDAISTDSLVTIGNVARMLGISFCVRASPPYILLLEKTQLIRCIPLDNELAEIIDV